MKAVIRHLAILAVMALGPVAAKAAEGRLNLLPPGPGTTRALVIGIDQYPNMPRHFQLQGAVADAKDIASALARGGVADLQLLLDTQVTRQSFAQAFGSLIEKTNAGDLIIITYAGHGSQDKERVPGSEADGKDETFLLSLLAPQGENANERILDDEVFHWLAQLAGKGAEVIFLADSCHGGGITKAAAESGLPAGIRGIARVYDPGEAGAANFFIAPKDDRLPVASSIPGHDDATLQMPPLTFLSGADAQSNVIEIRVAGETAPRGALSYAFARALDAQPAEAPMTRASLFKALRQTVLKVTQNKQYPVFAPISGQSVGRVLFRKTAADAAQLPTARSMQADGADGAALRPEASRPAPAIFWDTKTGNVVTKTGAIVAYGVAAGTLDTVAEGIRASSALSMLASSSTLDVATVPERREFVSEESFQLVVSGIQGRYLIIAALSGDGQVAQLFPSGNADALVMTDRLTLPMRVGPPFGTDTLIVFASTARRKSLELDLQLLNGRGRPGDLAQAFHKHWQPGDQLGLVSYQTRP